MSSKVLKYEAEPVFLGEHYELSEGPMAYGDGVAFIDINTGRVLVADLGEMEVDSWQLPDRVGTVVRTPDKNTFVVATGLGIVKLNLADKTMESFMRPLPEIFTCFNDGKVCPGGKFLLIGTKHLQCNAHVAGFYAIDTQGNVRRLMDGRVVSNGLTWPKATELVYLDSADLWIQKWAFNPDTGEISKPRIIKTLPDFKLKPAAKGLPVVFDGMTHDVEGNLFIAVYGAGKVLQVSPKGKLIAEIRLPLAAKPTSCAFVGEDLRTLIITTAVDGMSEEHLDQFPESGNLHRVYLEVPGEAPHEFLID
jgi:sugar lactone lactonase YvrE